MAPGTFCAPPKSVKSVVKKAIWVRFAALTYTLQPGPWLNAMTLKKLAVTTALLLLIPAAGCFRDVRTVRDVEREWRAHSLDVRTPDPAERMYKGRPDARPIHEKTGFIDLSRPLTLRQCIDIALECHPEVRRMRAKIDGARAHTRELETMGWAELLADVTYAPDAKMFLSEPDYFTGDRLRNNTARFNVALRQPIYFEWQRRRALLNANNEEIARLQVEMEMRKNDAAAAVCHAFLDLAKARVQCRHRRGVYNLDHKRVMLVRELVKRRLLLPASEHKAATFMEAARRDCEAADGVLLSKERKLKNILGIDSRLRVDIAPVEFKEIPLIPYEQARDYLVNRSMEFDALDHQVEKARWDKEFGRWDDIDLDFFIRYGIDLDDWSKTVDDFLILTLALRYPLMHIKARNARVVRGLKRREEFEIEREIQQQRLLNDLDIIYASIEEHRADMNSFLAAIEEARENLRMAQVFERTGTTDESLKTDPENVLLSIISAIALLNAKFKYQEARLDYLGEVMDQYKLLDRASELTEFAREYDFDARYAPLSRSMLVKNVQQILESPDERSRLLETCREYGISAIYLRVQPVHFRLNALTEFIAQAHRQRLSVFAVMGGEKWLAAESPKEGESAVSEFFALQDRCLTPIVSAEEEEVITERPNADKFFDGLHIDFGEKRLADWNDGTAWPEERKEQMWRILSYARKRRDEAPVRVSTSISVDSAVGESLLASLAEHCDCLSVYFHCNKQSDLVALAQPLLDRGRQHGVKVRVVLETAQNLPDEQTYYKKGSYIMWGEAAEIAEKLEGRPAFAGVLIDDFRNLISMRK